MEEIKTINEIPNKITITVIGNRCSGKTTLLNSLIFPEIINYKYIIFKILFININDINYNRNLFNFIIYKNIWI